ncbi:n-adenine-specific dna methyltransferase 2 [Nannochloropsis oceanica]
MATRTPQQEDDETTAVSEVDVESELSQHTLAMLKEHLAEKEHEGPAHLLGKENYGLAQFWYSEETAKALLMEALSHVTDGGVVAVLSAPSLMVPAQELEGGKHFSKLQLFEIDERFGVQFPDNFYHYDYNAATVLPTKMLRQVTAFVIDPPRLNIDTLKEYFISTRLLAKPCTDGSVPPCIVVTAAVLEDAVREEFGLRPVLKFEIIHTSKLGNPLQAYTNYPPKVLDASSWQETV